jgi:predicted nucleotidyltransferase
MVQKDLVREPNAEVLLRLRAEMPGILEDRPVMIAYLYGSVLDGSELPSSDVDIGLVLDPNDLLSPYERMQLEFDIAAEIEGRCDVREADVRSIDIAPLTVQGKVVSEGELLYSRDEEFRIGYEVRTRKLYFDFLPVVEMMQKAFFRHLQEEGLISGKT